MSLNGTGLAAAAPATVMRVALLGYGRVGQAVAAGIAEARDALADVGVVLHCTRALVRDPSKRRAGPALRCETSATAALADATLVIEALGGREPACSLVRSALDAGIPVVSANKTLVAYHGRELRALAAARGTTFACDAAVLAGVPFLGALARRPLIASARQIAGVINGTSHVITGALDSGLPFATALADAIARGYAEPDSMADISGRDAAEKLCILLHLAGHDDATPVGLTTRGLDGLDAVDFRLARQLGGVIKPVALASLDARRPGAWVGPAFVDASHPFARLQGVDNSVAFTDRLGQTVTFTGPGAGPVATARTIIDDAVEVALGGRRPPSPARPRGVSRLPLEAPPSGRWFIRLDRSAVAVGELAQRLAAAGAPAMHLRQAGSRIVACTAPAAWSDIRTALPPDAAAHVLCLPVLDAPASSDVPHDPSSSQETQS